MSEIGKHLPHQQPSNTNRVKEDTQHRGDHMPEKTTHDEPEQVTFAAKEQLTADEILKHLALSGAQQEALVKGKMDTTALRFGKLVEKYERVIQDEFPNLSQGAVSLLALETIQNKMNRTAPAS